MMKYLTDSGAYVSAQTRGAAAVMAAEYGFGALVAAAPAPVKPRRPMTYNRAHYLRTMAEDFPRHGAGWPIDAQEREAAAILAAAHEEDGDDN